MKRLSLLTLTMMLVLGCQRSDANPVDAAAQPNAPGHESSDFTRLTACYDADEWTCAVETEIVRLTNVKRATSKLVKLDQVFESSYIARGHSKSMTPDNISHNGFDQRFETLQKELPEVWRGRAGENVAYFSSRSEDPEAVAAELVKMWWNSKGHRDNMMNKDYVYIGVGITRNSDNLVFATQMFH
ncbi:MAG TPA: CAP domain-containing protein [Oligoflexus sp.]|uniref:CAP domain-containing protein n=1 Tax=Oligoflexus sp. TaxID=1971216 RepID=UPI002D40C3F7|nr:CAP domain-containing protein [Oligoflexus sp.]HYX32714.1 CAP domain-containing protein [Oligoflexus sp.]